MTFARWTAVAVIAAELGLAGAGTAAAHVGISAPDAEPGEFAVVTVRVPTESATAGTVKLEITLPQDHPLAVVRNEAVAGWDVTQKRGTLATPVDNGHGGKVSDYVSSVTFTAREGVSIRPGEFGEFKLQVGPLPHTSELAFPAIQTYSDGSVVSWIERSSDGTTPDKPAPVLKLAAAQDGTHGQPAAAPTESVTHKDSSRRLAEAALVVALGALVVSAAPKLRRVRIKR
ncbi:YcnI family protein [Nocardia sp. CDC153]|uniref:YcnI family protein n=1 Tax=Nocardia sp. CDC153 TaxID=3112167 RepID=UPI002DB84B14|nr:YcnI family protein [Nocardia sp. CDC153]MEC3955535.1 YcnI family protein [Nocardia sp. CDC153]